MTYRKFWSLMKPHKYYLFWGMFFLAVSSSMVLLYPQAIKILIDESLTSKDFNKVNQTALIMIGIFVIQSISSGLRYFLFTLTGQRIVMELRSQLFESMMFQEISFFDKEETGQLMSRLSSDTTTLQNAVSVNISMLVRFLATTLGGFAFMFYTSWKLTLTIILVVPPIALGAAYFGRKIRRLSRAAQDELAIVGKIAEEGIGGIRTLRSFGQEKRETKRYTDKLQSYLEIIQKRIVGVSVLLSSTTLLGQMSIVFVVWLGGKSVFDGQMSLGELTSFIFYMITVAFALGALGNLWADFMSAIGASERVFEIIEQKPVMDQQPGSDNKKIDKLQGHFGLHNLSFSYPTRPDELVLTDFQLSIKPGEKVALVGSSGAGKTTVAKLLLGFYEPQVGEIQLDHTPIRGLDSHWYRSQIGLVAQDTFLISASIKDNLYYGNPDASDRDIEEACRIANADEFIDRFDNKIETLVGERGVQLSGGQKQRLAIARAILKKPKLLILDEATSSLDTKCEELVKQALDQLMEDQTTLIMAHRLSTVKNADRIVVMDQGRIVQSGSHDQLMRDSHGLYYQLVQKQFG